MGTAGRSYYLWWQLREMWHSRPSLFWCVCWPVWGLVIVCKCIRTPTFLSSQTDQMVSASNWELYFYWPRLTLVQSYISTLWANSNSQIISTCFSVRSTRSQNSPGVVTLLRLKAHPFHTNKPNQQKLCLMLGQQINQEGKVLNHPICHPQSHVFVWGGCPSLPRWSVCVKCVWASVWECVQHFQGCARLVKSESQTEFVHPRIIMIQ